MKTRILLILALVTLNISFVSADNNNNNRKGFEGPSAAEFSVPLTILAPVTPMEATFEDTQEANHTVISVITLAPFEEITSSEEAGTIQGNQNSEPDKKGQPVHPDFPSPCDAKYGCGL
jgi:hypothetical protein